MKTFSMFLLLFVASIPAYSQETAIPQKALPAEVVKALRTAEPNSKIRSVTKEVGNGTTTYEINCKVGATKKTISISSDGKIMETEEQISAQKLPQAVAQTLSSRFANGKILRIESSVKQSGTVYEVLMKHGGKKIEVAIDPDGSVLKNE